MKIKVAEYAGFCFGVERAIKIVNKSVEQHSNVVTYGPIIHNPQVVAELAAAGVMVIENPAVVRDDMTVIVRTHGIEKDKYEQLEMKAGNIIDATCPFVIKARNAAIALSRKGLPVIVVGEYYHPEVQGIVSHIEGEYYIISSPADVEKLPIVPTYGVIAQTTQNEQVYEDILKALKSRAQVLEAAHTICSATHNRQASAISLAGEVDRMIIVGGRNSANTTRLYQLCKEVCPKTYLIETEADLEDEMFAGAGVIGISAGASTPNKLVYNVRNCILRKGKMSEEHNNNEEMGMEDFESMLEESLKLPTKGSTVKGEVAQIQDNEVIVNIGAKSEGIIRKQELPANVKVGDAVELIVVGFSGGGYVQLSSRSAEDNANWGALDKVVKVKIESHNDKGYRGKIGEMDAFIPENHIDLKSQMKDPSYYIGKVFSAKVLKVSGGKFRSALVSPKEFVLEESNKGRQAFFDQIKEGDVMKGVVKTLKDYGAFISFGVVDGFLHKSNIAWGRPRNPAKYMEEGQELEVMILEINRDNGKIEIGLKQLSKDPWDEAMAKYPVESTVNATIIGRRRNGYIAEVEPGVDAFIPLEELSWLRNARININSKDVVEGRVLSFDDEHKRLVISVKMMNENPWKTMKDETPEGSVVTGTVKNITDFGVFVDFGQSVDGLIRKGDISWGEEPADLKSLYNVGDQVEVKVLRIDEERERVSLGVKQLAQNPWKDVPKSGAKPLEVTITEVTKTGLTVDMGNGLFGTIPLNELDPEKPSLDNYAVGDVLPAMIVKADQRERSVILSIKKQISTSERKEANEYMKKMEKTEGEQGFGNIFKDKFNQ